MPARSLQLSIIIPIFNEQDNIFPLYEKLVNVLEKTKRSFEGIFVNDGSVDHSEEYLYELAKKDKRIKIINLKRNFGQTAAIMAGIDYAKGDIIIPMDGDLQNDPIDIPKLIDKIEEGFDVVSGWRKDRKDKAIRRKLMSRIANKFISRITGVFLHDYGCTLKAYRKEVIKDVKLYGEMHRFIPIFASWEGSKITEIPVTHQARVKGVSKYGLERILKVILDLVVIKFLDKYKNKPIYVFGGFGLLSILFSFISGMYAIYLKAFQQISFILTPLPLLTVMTLIMGIMSILMGLLAEIIMRTYYESQGKPAYLIRNILNLDDKV